MAVKMAERNVNPGIFLARTQDGLSVAEIGDWAEGANEYGPWVACTHEHLVTAVRFLIVQRRLSILREAAPEIDSAAVEQQLKNIRSALGRVRTIKTKLTELGGCSDAINEQAEHLRTEIKEALASIEEAMRASEARRQVGHNAGSMQIPIAASSDCSLQGRFDDEEPSLSAEFQNGGTARHESRKFDRGIWAR